MTPLIAQMRQEMARVAGNCDYYRKTGNENHLINEIGVLRGMMYFADLIGFEYKKEMYYKSYIRPIYESITKKYNLPDEYSE